jgi:CRISPR-associated protein Cas5d
MREVLHEPLALRVSGELGCFTRPELKAERVSYPVMTPSAARGVIEAVLWKPQIRWRIERIKVLAPIRWVALRRNEVSSRAVAPAASVVESGGAAPMLLIEDDRAQRNTVALRNVDYVIEAHFELTDKAGRDDSPTKYVEMFRRRVERGQHFHQPYLGCREFVGDIQPVDESTPSPVEETLDLGLMLYDLEFGGKKARPLFFPAKLARGILEVPQVLQTGLPAGGVA